MVKLRLQRTGSKNDPHYRIVAADSRSPRDGKFIDLVGHYHPTSGGTNQTIIHKDKVLNWIQKGAQPSETVLALLKAQGIVDSKFKTKA